MVLLTISTRNRYIEGDSTPLPEIAESDYVVLSLSDTGMGMEQDKFPHIFEPFNTSKVRAETEQAWA